MEPAEQKADMTPNVEETKHVLEAERVPTPEEERAVVRKIDMVVLPLMCFVFFLQYLDKQSLSYAAVRNILDGHLLDRVLTRLQVFGLLTDLDLTAEQYSWCSSIFYVGTVSPKATTSVTMLTYRWPTGQLVAEYPFIYLMSKFPLTKLVGVTV
jgi:hypothetical protein